ncbi:LANO_0B02278g1_1 [Lachancea nothofagi CBS 11611]|uniref:LANO_0B02278g1_1 n=1 Tax=Lachancea nothofagi CBS 11611 TaxID=1266666 RepID=A0A1G4IVW1_9SACH|nr:LANO_0B02278g1_1 [Lachancea nothofagi CBS 11611]
MTTSNKDFHFGLLRVSMIQLLKSQGFDRAPVTTVDAFTDLYVRFFQLLTLEVMKLSRSRMDEYEDIALQDVSQALMNVGLLKPMNTLDIYDENPDLVGDLGMQKFKKWCLHNAMPREARAVATPTADLLRPKDKSSKPLSMIPEYINQLDKATKKGASHNESHENDLVDQMINNGDMDDWVHFSIRKQQLNLAKRISGRDVKDINNLPALPGLKHSTLAAASAQDASEVTPPEPVITDGDERALKEKAALMKMTAFQKENRLENIRLSFEDEELTGSDSEVNINDVGFVDEEMNQDLEAFERLENTMGLTLESDSNLQLAEAENLNDTFQRRDSFDFGDEAFHNHEFDSDNY